MRLIQDSSYNALYELNKDWFQRRISFWQSQGKIPAMSFKKFLRDQQIYFDDIYRAKQYHDSKYKTRNGIYMTPWQRWDYLVR